MLKNMKTNELIACGVGLVVGGIVAYFIIQTTQPHHHDMMSMDTHPIGYADNPEEVHVHSDFVLYLNNEQVDLTNDKYQSKAAQILHANIHLHDNNDEVIHRHDHGVTLGDFFGSLGFDLTNDCITNDMAVAFCTDDTEELMVFVNDERITEPATYVNEEEDRILIYHGNKDDNETIRDLLLDITDRACIYSGTCPERGTAPPESCGLTCEL
jgi:hypothetical protein